MNSMNLNPNLTLKKQNPINQFIGTNNSKLKLNEIPIKRGADYAFKDPTNLHNH